MKDKPKLIAIVGPTATGKSSLAVRLARRFKGEVVSADSRQVYRGMDIGTGKITKRERRGVPHHLLDVASPQGTFTAARYHRLATQAIRDILKRRRVPILCGGTGFYADAVLYGFELPPVKPNPELRKMLEAKTTEDLFKEISFLDPERAETIDRRNRRRLVRALEIVLTTRKPIGKLKKESRYDALVLGVDREKEELNRRIHERLIARLRQGMASEVQRLHRNGISWNKLDAFGLEYRYVSRMLKGELAKPEMIMQLESEIRKYAKRQRTWFKRNKDIHWITDPAEAERLAERFLKGK